ncbi:MAG: Diaminohydroxyphosphoribosylaminopyrimidine deaminase / 5-amino-6-(5-phosphoribosylamino)uracil reductase [uncultured Pyrinomonadaceae bacterium]|uniref:Riboflavin biosynthesis protein RibD n=1 Tax=uncultured Pyrinomonadaceae bacterium TaxID=2283094 RepID=A0A6J4PAC0_9BACT|nr:MAG: Diaminohydroxyphosphoribosylaminopyrimidine deaminase / 5-amino-6-(5-phosphoribosylamino)uracil reductase [uncultured Pyrinomonadaceae bacterium]
MTRRALELAAFGIGQVSPSPLVGCVIVAENGETIGEGSYIYENVTHAEVIALNQAGEKAKGGTAYVSLEPHAHTGRTKPCTEALINARIRRVVCPIEDPNPLVSGKGFQVLRENGIEVVTGILKDEAARLNEKFCVWHQKNRPFVHLKLAMSLDGRISLTNSVSTQLSGKESAARVQSFRHEHDAILVGGNTAFVDNPSLTDRSGKPRRRKLARIVLDNRLRVSIDSTLAQTAKDAPTIIFSASDDETKIAELEKLGVEVVRLNARNLHHVLSELKTRQLQSVLVEGGTEIAGAFCDAKLVDKLTFIVAPIVIGGHDAPMAIGGEGADSLDGAMRLRDLEIIKHGDDFELTGYPQIRDEG